jgi:S1-C subfamily serine protease
VDLNGTPITEPGDLSSTVLEHKPGDRVKLTVERGGDRRTIEVQLGTRPDDPTQLEQG